MVSLSNAISVRFFAVRLPHFRGNDTEVNRNSLLGVTTISIAMSTSLCLAVHDLPPSGSPHRCCAEIGGKRGRDTPSSRIVGFVFVTARKSLSRMAIIMAGRAATP